MYEECLEVRHPSDSDAQDADTYTSTDMEKRQDQMAQQTQDWQQAVIREFGIQGQLLIERQEEAERMRVASASTANVTTNYYVFLASHPCFDPRTGTCKSINVCIRWKY